MATTLNLESQAGNMDTEKILELLSEIKLFASLSADDLQWVLKNSVLRTFAPGEVILREDDESLSVIVVLRGKAGVFMPVKGGRRFVQTLQAKGCFGEVALKAGKPSRMTIVAQEETEVLKISAASMRPVLEKALVLSDVMSDAELEAYCNTGTEDSLERKETPLPSEERRTPPPSPAPTSADDPLAGARRYIGSGSETHPAPPTAGPLLPARSRSKGIGNTLRALGRRFNLGPTERDPVDCTVFAPPAVKRDESFMVQVFAHRPEQTEAAQQLAREFDSESQRRGFKSLEAEIRRGARLTIHLAIPDFEVADPVQSLTWQGRPESVQFEVGVPAEMKRETVIGTVTASEDGVPLGHVKFKISVAGAAAASPESVPTGEAAHRYRKAFISYATQDRAEVLKRVQMLARLKIKFFQDLLDLEPGARWEQQLYRHIDESDLFLLFWSSAARQSEWVMNEVKYALSRKRDDDTLPPEIIPVIIEGPPPVAPPPELAHLHFNDYLVYFMAPPGA